MSGATDPPSPGDWSVTGPDEVLHTGFFRVLRRPLRLPDGRETTWTLTDVPDTVAVLPLTTDGRAVLVEQFRVGPMRTVVSLPGGIVDPGEDVAGAAARELREETGWSCERVELVGATWPNSATRPRHAAVAHGCRPAGQQQPDPMEDLVVHVWPLDRLRAELRTGRMGTTEQAYLALDHLGLL